MMDVALLKRKCTALFIGIFMLQISCAQAEERIAPQPSTFSDDVKKGELYLRYRLTKSIETYSEALNECSGLQSVDVPIINQEEIDKLGFTEKELVVTLTYMRVENYTKCASNELGYAVYDLARYIVFVEDNKINTSEIDFSVTAFVDDIDDFSSILKASLADNTLVVNPQKPTFRASAQLVLTPTFTNRILFEAKYQAISHSKKAYVRQNIGDSIVSVSDVLEFNKLYSKE